MKILFQQNITHQKVFWENFSVFCRCCCCCFNRPHYVAALFIRLGLPLKLIRHENRAFLFANALQTGGIWNRWICVLVLRINILKTKLFENDDFTIILWLPCPSFLKHKSKMTGDCYAFPISLASCRRKTFDALLEWNFCFQISPTWCGRDLNVRRVLF